MAEIRDLDIDEIKTDVDEIQTRLGLDEKRIEILCEKYTERGPDAFPLPVVFLDADGVYWLASGHYRLAAIRMALSPDPDAPRVVRAEVRDGSKRDAAFFAASANSEHGTQLTWEEMRRLVIRLLRDPKWGEMGDREMARLIGTSHTYVSKIHKELDEQDASVSGLQMPSKRKVKTQRGGKEFSTTVGKTRRDRDSKPKTTTTIQPDNPAVPQTEPMADQEVELTSNDAEEAVTTSGFDHQAVQTERNMTEDGERPTDDDQEHNQETDTSTAVADLKDAWSRANRAERESFLQWVITHEEGDIKDKALEVFRVQLAQSNEELR